MKKITIVSLLILLPVPATISYLYQTKPEFVEQISLMEELKTAQTDEEKSASVKKMLLHLEQRLVDDPEDVESWSLLTDSYTTLKRYNDALRTIENLYRIEGKIPAIMFRYADIMSMANNGRFEGKPNEIINEALELEPMNKDGLWLSGLAALQHGDIKKALKNWHQLHKQFDEGSESQVKIKEYIDLIHEQVIENENTSIESVALQVEIILSEDLLSEVNRDDYVYIYAKNIDNSLVPLAILSKKVSDLPTQVVLDDSMALVASNKLSDHKQVQIIARISKKANTQSMPGDLIGTLDFVPTHTHSPLKLIINSIIQ